MIKPVYGFEQNYEISDTGEIFNKHTKVKLTKASNASLRQDRYRLADRKYYDLKYLIFKSFNPDVEVEINDDKIIFINGNCRDNRLVNLKLLEQENREDISNSLSTRYGEKICPIPEFKNYYISENGNLYSYYNSTSKQIKLFIGTDGYYQVKIPDNFGVTCHLKIHRLVATIFVLNNDPSVKTVVHHKDENKLNNNYLNLEWTTLKQNTVYSIGKKCCMLDKNNCILSIHESIADLSREYGVDSSTASKQCRGNKSQFTNGWKARFFDDETHNFVATNFD